MSSDYLELLDPDALGILAETTGMASRADASRFFAERPNGIRVALGSEEAARLLSRGPIGLDLSHRRLMIAISVHRVAEQICSAGWTARDDSPVDLPLLRFAGQGPFQTFMVDLLTTNLPADMSFAGLDGFDTVQPVAGSPERLTELLTLCAEVAETERAGALRLLGDEALFVAGIDPARAASIPLTAETIEALEVVLPKAVRGVLAELRPSMNTQLDAYLEFGPIWYRMASQNLLHRTMRETLSDMAREFTTARRFLVRVAQGPLAPLRDDLFALAGADAR